MVNGLDPRGRVFGPVKRVCASARITFPERTITSEPKFGTTITVETPTHVAGTMDFANGAIATVVMSFDVWGHHVPCIEVHGTEGTMCVPDPNGFGGSIRLGRAGGKEWGQMPLSHGYDEQNRGIGVADMAYALLSGRPHRANGDLTYHVLDVMHAFLESSARGTHVRIKSKCKRPAPLPMGLRHGLLDE